jgi:hypothetical protein
MDIATIAASPGVRHSYTAGLFHKMMKMTKIFIMKIYKAQ